MASVADWLRAETPKEMRALPAVDRVDLALRLGDEDLEVFQRARGLTPEEARLELRRRRRTGRQPSACLSDEPG